MLYALNFDNMYLLRTCKHLGPVWLRRPKYSLLLLLGKLVRCQCCKKGVGKWVRH